MKLLRFINKIPEPKLKALEEQVVNEVLTEILNNQKEVSK